MSVGNNMKYQVKNEIIRRHFLGASGVTLLGASMSGILCNVPSRDENQVVADTLQPGGLKKIFREAVTYPKLDVCNHIWDGSNAEQVDESCERILNTK